MAFEVGSPGGRRSIRRGLVVAFDNELWQAEVRLDGARQGVWLPVGQWVVEETMTAGQNVAVLLFDETNPLDAVVVGGYGEAGGQVAEHDHTIYAADLDSGAAPEGYVLTADGDGGASWDLACCDKGNSFQDRFDSYGNLTPGDLSNLWWLRIASNDFVGEWLKTGGIGVGAGELDETYEIEGRYALKLVAAVSPGTTIYREFSPALDLSQDSRFTDDDYISVVVYVSADMGDYGFMRVGFDTGGGHSFHYNWYDLSSGWHYLTAKKSDFTEFGSPDWSNVVKVFLIGTVNEDPFTLYIDDLRIVKANPDDPDDHNDTGPHWDKSASSGTDYGEWHIYEGNRTGEPGKPFSCGQVKAAPGGSPGVWYLYHKPMTEIDISTGTISLGVYLKGSNGKAGFGFFIKDVTAGTWDMYAVELDTSGDTVKLVKWVGGSRSEIGSAAPLGGSAPDQVVWLGVDLREFSSDSGRLKVYASLVEGNLIQAANLKITAQDTSLAGGGSVGLLSYEARCRFVNVVAGSPAHAEVADVAHALDGMIVAGKSKRVRFNPDTALFEVSDDGVTWTSLTAGSLAGLSDTQISSPAEDQLLTFKIASGKWQNYWSVSAGNSPSKVALRDGSGDLTARLFRPEYNAGAANFSYVNVQNARGTGDNYMRAASLYEFRNRIGCGSVYRRSANKWCAAGAWATIDFDNLDWALGTNYPYWNAGVNGYTVQESGIYHVRFQVHTTRTDDNVTTELLAWVTSRNSGGGDIDYCRFQNTSDGADAYYPIQRYGAEFWWTWAGTIYAEAGGYIWFRMYASDRGVTIVNDAFSRITLARIA